MYMGGFSTPGFHHSEGGMIRLERLIELNCLIRVVRAYHLGQIRQTLPCRAIRGNSISVNSTPRPPLNHHAKCP